MNFFFFIRFLFYGVLAYLGNWIIPKRIGLWASRRAAAIYLDSFNASSPGGSGRRSSKP